METWIGQCHYRKVMDKSLPHLDLQRLILSQLGSWFIDSEYFEEQRCNALQCTVGKVIIESVNLCRGTVWCWNYALLCKTTTV
jgi:hypothetical protein